MRVASIHVYPVKGARGISLAAADVLRTGLRHDRRFMVVDEDGDFLTQRSHPTLALVSTAIERGSLVLSTPTGARAVVSLDDAAHRAKPRRRAVVWRDEVACVDVVDALAGDAAALLSFHLGVRCTLVYMPYDVVRAVEAPHGRDGDRVGFADAYPLLVAALASLADLNAKLAEKGEPPVPMDRFRPNLVVEGGAPFDEERFARAKIGDLPIRMPKRCSRCDVTTVDPRTGAVGKEPLRTLAAYRRVRNEVFFAVNAIPDREGSVAVGDPVVYLDPVS